MTLVFLAQLLELEIRPGITVALPLLARIQQRNGRRILQNQTVHVILFTRRGFPTEIDMEVAMMRALSLSLPLSLSTLILVEGGAFVK